MRRASSWGFAKAPGGNANEAEGGDASGAGDVVGTTGADGAGGEALLTEEDEGRERARERAPRFAAASANAKGRR